jgi:hypothetical protein
MMAEMNAKARRDGDDSDDDEVLPPLEAAEE